MATQIRMSNGQTFALIPTNSPESPSKKKKGMTEQGREESHTFWATFPLIWQKLFNKLCESLKFFFRPPIWQWVTHMDTWGPYKVYIVIASGKGGALILNSTRAGSMLSARNYLWHCFVWQSIIPGFPSNLKSVNSSGGQIIIQYQKGI